MLVPVPYWFCRIGCRVSVESHLQPRHAVFVERSPYTTYRRIRPPHDVTARPVQTVSPVIQAGSTVSNGKKSEIRGRLLLVRVALPRAPFSRFDGRDVCAFRPLLRTEHHGRSILKLQSPVCCVTASVYRYSRGTCTRNASSNGKPAFDVQRKYSPVTSQFPFGSFV